MQDDIINNNDNTDHSNHALAPPELMSRINYITSCQKINNMKPIRLDLKKIKYDHANNKISYDNLIISRKNIYVVSYNCITCDRENIVCLNKFVTKIENNNYYCFYCRNSSGQFTTIEDKIVQDVEDFKLLPEKNRISYEKKLMSQANFEKIRKYIKSYNNDRFDDIDNIVYIPYFRPTESTKYYESCFYNNSLDIVSCAINIKMECHHCKYNFTIDNIKNIRNQHPIFCRICSVKFSDSKTKYECNLSGNNVSYRTKIQHKFIKYCNNNGMVVYNGPDRIVLNDIKGDASVDFYVPAADTYIDAVGNLEYQAVNSKRTDLLGDYFNNNYKNSNYIIIHPKNYVSKTRKLLFDVKTIVE